jgi:ParB-like chromosome segregation protein Spo0J
MKISEIKLNKSNPRIIKDYKFEKLKKSISEFPKMLELRPMVIDNDNVVLGGNMRLTALKDLGYKEIPDNWVKRASELTDEEKQRFVIADNVGFGDWDWDILANEWDSELIADWGLDVPSFEVDVDYSILDDQDTDHQLQDMADGVKKAIQIEFEPEHYDEAYQLVKFWREKGAYVGKMILDYLKLEKSKL